MIHKVFSTYDVTQLGVKDKLVLRCVGDILRRGALLFVLFFLVGISVAFQISMMKFP